MSGFYNSIKIAAQQFRLNIPRNFSRLSGGQAIPYANGFPYWRGSVNIPDLYHADQAATEVDLMRLERPGQTFYAYDARFNGPVKDKGGAILGTATPTLASVSSDNQRISIEGLPSGYEITKGDYVGWIAGRRNLLNWSEDFSNVAWEKTKGLTVAADAIADPNGDITADEIIGSSDTLATLIQTLNNVEEGTTYTASWVVKNNDSTQSQFILRVDFTVFAFEITWSGGVPSFIGTTTATKTDLGNGWWRLVFSREVPVGSSFLRTEVRPDRNGGTASIYLWGAQLETGSLTAYQKTEDGTGLEPNRRALHRAYTGTVAAGGGVTPEFEVEPLVRPGTAAGAAVVLVRPAVQAIVTESGYGTGRPIVTGGPSIEWEETQR